MKAAILKKIQTTMAKVTALHHHFPNNMDLQQVGRLLRTLEKRVESGELKPRK